eukprot:m.165006 g.165006  ORF g.165006 m.165006 type:complete len:301 (+) comp12501_c0_seq1:269-1171(+)
MGRHKGHKKRNAWLDAPASPRRRTISEPPPSPPGSEDGSASPPHGSGRERALSVGCGRLVRFNVDNTLHVYPADPNVKLSPKRSKIPRRFDGPEWSIYKALRRHKRTMSEGSSLSHSSDDATDATDAAHDDTVSVSGDTSAPSAARKTSPTGPILRRLDERYTRCAPSPPPDGPEVTITDADEDTETHTDVDVNTATDDETTPTITTTTAPLNDASLPNNNRGQDETAACTTATPASALVSTETQTDDTPLLQSATVQHARAWVAASVGLVALGVSIALGNAGSVPDDDVDRVVTKSVPA